MSSSASPISRKSRAFYVDCLGYIVTDEDKDALYLRGVEERNHHSVVLRKSDDIAALAIGFKVGSEEDLDKAADWLERRKLPVSWPNVPFQGRTLRTVDPVGMPLDLYFKMDRVPLDAAEIRGLSGRAHPAHRPHQLLHARRAGVLRLLHRARLPPDRIHRDRRRRPKLWAVWMQRKGNAHDLAFTNGRGPRLHHIGVWNSNALDILHTCDVMATTGYLPNMERGPGRHGISNAFFLYVRDPDGHRVELFTSDYLTVDHRPRADPLDAATTRSARRCGATRRRSPGSRKARRSPACRCASRCSRRAAGRGLRCRLPPAVCSGSAAVPFR